MTKLVPPLTFKENIEYRVAVRRWAAKSPANRRWLMEKCKEDFFFWLETFAWIYEPRPVKGKPKVIPFIPWEHQREPIQVIIDNLGYKDIGLEKARGEGASWSCLMIILWRWLFYDMESFGLVSMNQDAADNQEDPNSLGWKLDYQLRMLPKWMAGEKGKDYTRNVSKHTWINKNNESSITAYACTGDMASGGRKTAFFMDELSKFPRGPDEDAMAATEPITDCRLLVSTPKGKEGAYYRCMTEKSSMIKLILDWTKNPTRNYQLFRIDYENQRLLRPTDGTNDVFKPEWEATFWNEQFPDLQRRGFNVESKNKIWSPWYVSRCLRARMTPRKIAQEYDRDYGGSSSRFFRAGLIEDLLTRTRRPLTQGDIICDLELLEVEKFTKQKNGRLKLWVELAGADPNRLRPPRGEYVLGIDVATGQGGKMSSNSVISIIDRMTGTKVGEFATPNLKPEQLAEHAVALAKWFATQDGRPSYMIWEGNGPGGSFRNRILESQFRNFYFRTPLKTTKKKPTKEPGWWSGKDQKRELLSKYRHSLTERYFENLSEKALEECTCYIEDTGGKVTFVAGESDEDDPANDGENHGDRVIADALASFGMELLNGGANVQAAKAEVQNLMRPPEGSFAWRRKKHMDARKPQVGWK
jgi:hypothetical protein